MHFVNDKVVSLLQFTKSVFDMNVSLLRCMCSVSREFSVSYTRKCDIRDLVLDAEVYHGSCSLVPLPTLKGDGLEASVAMTLGLGDVNGLSSSPTGG